MVFGLVLDRVGYGPAGVVAVTMPRVAGGVLALLAVGVSLTGAGATAAPLWMLVLPFLAGMGVAWQQATNGRLRQRVGTPLTATLVNFVVGTALLVVAAAVHLAIAGPPQPFPADPWLYIGGAIGVVYIFLAASIVVHTGVLLLGLGTIVGQLIASIVLDVLWPASGGIGLAREALAVAIALASVVVVLVPWRRPGSRRS